MASKLLPRETIPLNCMKLLAWIVLEMLVVVCQAGAEWTPAFDLDNCTHRADMVAAGKLDSQGVLKIDMPYKNWEAAPIGGVLNIDLDPAHREALRAALGDDGPYEVVVFLGPPQTRPAPLPPLRPLLATYPGLVAFDHEGGVYLTPDDTAKGLLVKSPADTKASFLEALSLVPSKKLHAWNAPSVNPKEYDAALLVAVAQDRYDLAKALLAAHADVDAASSQEPGMEDIHLVERGRGYPVLTRVVRNCCYKASNPALDFLRLLLTKGADPNLTDRYNITPLMMADRVGSEEAATLLRKVGAIPFDPTDLKTQAALVLIDAMIMNSAMCWRDVGITHQPAPYSFEKFVAEHDMRSGWVVTYKVFANRAVDVLGNPYILYSNAEHDVRINPKTIEALKSVVGADYWEGYVLKPGDLN